MRHKSDLMHFRGAFSFCVVMLSIFLFSATKRDGNQWYVSPRGTSDAAKGGTLLNPWNLQTALSQPSKVKPGDTIWLRGGIYTTNVGFKSRLAGTPEHPLTLRQYPGERATLSDNRQTSETGLEATLLIKGRYTNYWGFEVQNTNTNRGVTKDPIYRPIGVSIGDFIRNTPTAGSNTKLINLVIHDTGIAIGFWESAIDSDLYGNLIYNCGNQNAFRNFTNGHGIYTDNTIGIKTIRDNIVTNLSGLGIQAFAVGVVNYILEGNVISNSGILNDTNYRYNNILFQASRPNQIDNITIKNNYTYQSNSAAARGDNFDAGVCMGCIGAYQNGSVNLENNYFVGGIPALFVHTWSSVTVKRNTFVSSNGLINLESSNIAFWDHNRYFTDGPSKAFIYQGLAKTFSQWKSTTQSDADSTYTADRPTGKKIWIRPNAYDRKRAHIIIYNWNLFNEVQVDLSKLMRKGTVFEIRNSQNYYGQPVVSGPYQGESITLPMSGLSVAIPIGNGSKGTAISTGPEFNAFVLIQK